jgi:hypothetical protein
MRIAGSKTVLVGAFCGTQARGSHDARLDCGQEVRMTNEQEEQLPEATRRLARVAGAVYMLLGMATIFGFYHAPLVRSDLDALAQSLTKSGVLFRVGVVTDLLSTVLSVPLALLLYQLLKGVDKTKAFLMALLLILAMPISFVLALNYVAAHWLLSGASMVAAIATAEREALGMLFLNLHVHGVLAVEIFWGLWLVPFGLLVRKSRFLPRALGILLVIAGAAYISHSVVSLLLGGARFMLYERATMLARAAGEFPIMLWLLIKGAEARPQWPQPGRVVRKA